MVIDHFISLAFLGPYVVLKLNQFDDEVADNLYDLRKVKELQGYRQLRSWKVSVVALALSVETRNGKRLGRGASSIGMGSIVLITATENSWCGWM